MTKNPCVSGSIPSHTSFKIIMPCELIILRGVFLLSKNGVE